MAGAIQQQVLIPFTHQTHDLPAPDFAICYYASDNPRGLWRQWKNGGGNGWQTAGQPAGYGEGGIIQNLDIGGDRSIWDWNAGGGNMNGGANVFNWNNGGLDFYIGVLEDSDGRYLDFSQVVGFDINSAGPDDSLPLWLSPANGAENLIEGANTAGAVSWGMWFKHVKANNGTNTARQGLASISTNASSAATIALGFYLDDSDMKLKAVGRNSSGTYSVRKSFSYVFSVNTLTCILITKSSSGVIKLYVDGTLRDSYTESLTVSSWGFTVGSPAPLLWTDNSYTSASFCGKWYKSAWWRTELSATDAATFGANGSLSPAVWS